MMKSCGKIISICAIALAVTACSKDEKPPLQGERLSILELERALKPDTLDPKIQAEVVPAAWQNSFWPQSGGYPNHSMQNLALAQNDLNEVWNADIGEGSRKNLPLISQPIVVDGKVFTLDTDSTLSAFDVKTGKRVWETDVRDPDEDDPVIGGGVSYASGVLYVTNGFDEVLAVHPDNGEIFWRTPISAPSRAAPTIMDGRVFVTTLNNRLQALNAADGSILWDYAGVDETAGLLGTASAAVNYDIVIPAFSSGEITALRVENGSVAWSDNLANAGNGLGNLSGIADIKGLPVIDKGLVIAMSFSGRLVAIDERTGARVWQREIGGTNTPWVAGDHLFVLTSDNQLISLSRSTGAIRWIANAPKPEDKDDEEFFVGPVLAGGRLIIAGSRGGVFEFNADNGEIVKSWNAGGKITIAPIVAGNTLYLLTDDGTLKAYR